MRGFKGNLLKVAAFVIVTTLMTGVVGLVMGDVKIQKTEDYAAVFTNVSGLESGVDVRAAGVSIGSVTKLELQDDATVKVSFNVPADMDLTSATHVRIRYANLTGDRYLDLTDAKDSTRTIEPGSTIPVSQTQPALNLDELYAGFQPLMQAMSPADVNQLTDSLIQVAQGQSSAVDSLLGNVGSFTASLAERDELIGSVVANLTTVLGTVDDRRGEVEQLITGLDSLMAGLAQDRETIGASVEGINTMAVDLTQLLTDVRPGLQGTLEQTGIVADTLANDIDFLNDIMSRFPNVLKRLHRGGAYGSYFNFYLCGVRVRLTNEESVGFDTYTPWIISSEKRCHFQEGGSDE